MEDTITAPEVDDSIAGPGVEELEKVGIPEAPAEEVDESTGTETEAIETDDSSGGEGDEQEAVELIEFDVGGEKFSIEKANMPDDVKDKIQAYAKTIEANSTKKSQAVAEEIKGLKADREAVRKLDSLQRNSLDIYSRGMQVRNDMQAYQSALSKVDPETNMTLWQSDPDTARQYSDVLSQKTTELNTISSQLTQKEAEITSQTDATIAQQFEKGKATLERRIPGITKKVESVIDYVVNVHGEDREISQKSWAIQPAHFEIAYKAMLFDQIKDKTKNSAKPGKKTVTPVKPIAGKAGKVMKNPSAMNPEQYSKWKAAKVKAGTWD